MQGRRVQQINNLVITEINSNSYILWSPDDKILDASRNMNELAHEAATCKSFTARGARKSVLVDVDSTLADFHHALQRLLGEHGYNYIPENLTDYHGSPANQIGVDWGIVRKCMQTPTLYTDRYFKLYKGVDDALSKLRRHVNTVGYTGAENNTDIYRMRVDFCNKHKLEPNVYIGDKNVIVGYDALFDDNPYVIDKWVKAKVPTKIFMIAQPYNRHIITNELWGNRVIRCSSFAEAADLYVKKFCR